MFYLPELINYEAVILDLLTGKVVKQGMQHLAHREHYESEHDFGLAFVLHYLENFVLFHFIKLVLKYVSIGKVADFEFR